MSELNERLRDWDLSVQQLAEQADARLADANQLVRDLHAAGRAKPWVLIGPVMSVLPYNPGFGPEDSGQVTQALLVIPDGLGVMFVDTEEYNLFPIGPGRWVEARRLFTPIENCRPLTRVQFLPFAAELVSRLTRHLDRRPH